MGSRPTRSSIVAAHEGLVARLGRKYDGEFDPLRDCWGCGVTHRTLERAHIIPASAGGSSYAGNFFLLCSPCHRAQPDAASEAAQTRWLIERQSELQATLERIGDVVGAVMKRARDLAGDHAEALVGRWSEQVNVECLVRGAFSDTGRGLPENLYATARAELIESIERFVSSRKSDLFREWISDQA